MQNFITFISNYEKLFGIIEFTSLFILAILLYRKSGNVEYLKEVFEKMKYRTSNYQDSVKDIPSQTFSHLQPVYRLNKVTNELELTEDVVDLQEVIESFKDTALQSLLDRFMPTTMDETADYTAMQGDLDFLTEAIETAEEYREKFGLADNMSIQDIYARVKVESDNLKAKLDMKKEVKNEKENVEEGK